MSQLEKSFGQSHDANEFYCAFFGSTDESRQHVLEQLILGVVTKFKYSVKWNNPKTSGFLILELLVMIMKQVDECVLFQKLKYPLNQLLTKYYFFIDDMMFDCYKNLAKREFSIKIPDKVAFIALTNYRHLLIEFFFLSVCVSSGQRRTMLHVLNPRLLDIIVSWVKEKFDNSFVMVAFESSSDEIHEND